MSEVLHVARKEVLRRRKDPFAIAVWLLIPLSLAAIFALIFGNLSGGGGMPKAALLVVAPNVSPAPTADWRKRRLSENVACCLPLSERGFELISPHRV